MPEVLPSASACLELMRGGTSTTLPCRECSLHKVLWLWSARHCFGALYALSSAAIVHCGVFFVRHFSLHYLAACCLCTINPARVRGLVTLRLVHSACDIVFRVLFLYAVFYTMGCAMQFCSG